MPNYSAWEGFAIRHAEPNEMPQIIELVARVTDATLGWLSPLLHKALVADAAGVLGDEGFWRDAVVAVHEAELVGVMLVGGDRLVALWIDAAYHRQGLGGRLLRLAEETIRASGHPSAVLNVVLQNTNAVRFYEANGWEQGETYQHDKWNFPMLRMSKNLSAA